METGERKKEKRNKLEGESVTQSEKENERLKEIK